MVVQQQLNRQGAWDRAHVGERVQRVQSVGHELRLGLAAVTVSKEELSIAGKVTQVRLGSVGTSSSGQSAFYSTLVARSSSRTRSSSSSVSRWIPDSARHLAVDRAQGSAHRDRLSESAGFVQTVPISTPTPRSPTTSTCICET